MARTIPFDLGRGNARLDLLKDRLDTVGERAWGILRVAADVVNGETVVIGSDTWEVDVINSDSGIDTASSEFDNTDDPIVVTVTAHGWVVGDLIRVESEYMRVIRVNSVDSVSLKRGVMGTTVAAHADATDIYESDDIGAVIAAGNIPLGLDATLTPTVATDALIASINDEDGSDDQGASVEAVDIDTDTILIVAKARGTVVLATTETLAGVGNAWDAATMTGGAAASSRQLAIYARVPLAAEVTKGDMIFPLDFDPIVVLVQVVTTATGVPVAWVGAALVTVASGDAPAYVTVDNAGAVDWATTDTVYLLAA